MQRTGYLGLGSNVGDRAAHLRAAVELLREHGVEVEAVSSAYETEPVGEVLDQPDFLNAAVRIRTELEPEALLDVCKAIEVERGRVFAAPRHSPRPLDVDLLLLGDLELATERLTLPHREVTTPPLRPRAAARARPRAGPARRHRLADALAALGPGQRVERRGSLDLAGWTTLGLPIEAGARIYTRLGEDACRTHRRPGMSRVPKTDPRDRGLSGTVDRSVPDRARVAAATSAAARAASATG